MPILCRSCTLKSAALREERLVCTRVEEDWLIAMAGNQLMMAAEQLDREATFIVMTHVHIWKWISSFYFSLQPKKHEKIDFFWRERQLINYKSSFVVREIKRNVYKRKCEIVASSTVRMRSVWWIHSVDESIYKPFGGENVYNSGRNDGHREPNESNEKVVASQTTERMAAFIHSAKCLLLPF